ncbi:MAG: ABC transporter permease [Caldilineaceae bacterium]
MSNATTTMREQQKRTDSRAESKSAARPVWQVMFLREAQELWIGGKALTLLLIYSLLLGIQTYVLASNSELSLMPPNEMVYETLKIAISVSLFLGIIIGADAFSGERERATMEALILTPTSRRQLVVGKFLAGVTIWPAALIFTLPYMYVLAQGDPVFGQAVLWGAALGSILAPAMVGIGMLVSFWCNSNKNSYFIALGIFILLLLPGQLPGRAQTGFAGQFLQWVNPIAAQYHFLSKILVNNRTFAEWWIWLESSVVLALLVYLLLFGYAAPRLRLEAEAPRFSRRGRTVATIVVFVLMLTSAGVTTAFAQEDASPLTITPTIDYQQLKTTDSIYFDTVVANNGTEPSAPIIVAMNIINLDKEGDVVDPEDWSPQRTQYIDELPPGESVALSWRVNAILDGDYIVYMVAMPEPAGPEATSQAVASQGIHLTVAAYTQLNPAGVLPYAVAGPIILSLALAAVTQRRNRQIDSGGAAKA